MKRLATAAALLVGLVASACGDDVEPPPATTAVTTTTTAPAPACGRHGDATTYCGSAAAAVKVGNRTLDYRGGECHTGPGHVVVAIGTFPDQAGTTPDRFALGVGNYEQDPVFGTVTTPAPSGPGAAADGTHQRSTIRVYTDGRRYSASNFSVTLEGGRTRGTFSTTADDGTPVSGGFTC